MDVDVVSDGGPTAKGSTGFAGCAVALVLFVVLMAGVAWVLDELVKGLDGYGQLEQTGTGASGSVVEPYGPGASARYEDGLKITVSRPHEESDGTYRFTVTYDNDTGQELLLGGEPTGGADPALEVREGEPLDDDYSHDYFLTWLNEQECAAALTAPLGEGETRSVPVHVEPSRKGIPVTVEVEPADDDFRETAYFLLSLERPGRYRTFA
ncbi:hypothetical protein ACWDY7_07730 [Streptomyces calvus]|jgi:hypothetical protein|uniref:Uncharacterized protein n=1 Tax=Streptomyces calvus TaxID=67282 RepID=A0AA40SF97_9ACTN|nr:hypothetical protein [Streptomyces calvus]MBA8945233.1 hypothetical protein [Streptomyces calvus]